MYLWIGNPSEFKKHVTEIGINQQISITKLLSNLLKDCIQEVLMI